jgi:zinc transport system permease protein
MDAIRAFVQTLLPFEFMQFDFMVNALLAILLLTPLLGLLGTMAVNQQMAFFSDALGHSALTGIGLGILLGVSSDLLAMLVFGIVWALLICRIKQTGAASTDTIISVFSSTSVAAGVLVLSMGGGFAKYSSLLVGDVLAVQDSDLLYLLIALVAGIALWAVLYNSLLLSGISPSLARSRGIHNRLVECAFVVLVAVAVMLAIRWVGVMLINALLILPAAAGRNLARSSRQHAVYSVVIALVCGVAGLICAYYLDTTAGAAIVLFAASKVKGTRVCTCSDVYSAELSKRHNNSNILTMGARVVGVDLAKMIATHWLTAEFEGGRHQRRIDMITAMKTDEVCGRPLDPFALHTHVS